MRISDWSSDVCSSDLELGIPDLGAGNAGLGIQAGIGEVLLEAVALHRLDERVREDLHPLRRGAGVDHVAARRIHGNVVALLRRGRHVRSEEHTSELQSLMRISYAGFCLQKKKSIHPKQRLEHTNEESY